MQVVTALRRLGYTDKPGVGDHIRLFKLIDHPGGATTIQTGVDGDHMGRSDVDRVRRNTKLTDDAMWAEALKKKLDPAAYDQLLVGLAREELVLGFWKSKVAEQDRPEVLRLTDDRVPAPKN